MNNSSSVSSVSPAATSSSKLTNTQNKNKNTAEGIITINEKVNLTKQQHQVFKTICDTYQMSISEYMQQALVEAMRFDIEEGNFSDALLEKLDEGKKKENSKSIQPSSMKDELDMYYTVVTRSTF